MRYETPAPPAELGELDGLAYSPVAPRRRSVGRRGDPARGAILQGEPPRLRPRGPRGGALGGLLRPARARRDRRRARRPRARRRRHDRGAARRRPARPARVEHGRLPRRSSPPRALGARAVDRRSARRARTACGAALRSGELELPGRHPLARGAARRAPARRGGRAARGPAAAACTPRATSRSRPPTRASWRGARPHPRSELVVVPGGHHRSVQHDAELQGHSLRWLRGVISGAG